MATVGQGSASGHESHCLDDADVVVAFLANLGLTDRFVSKFHSRRAPFLSVKPLVAVRANEPSAEIATSRTSDGCLSIAISSPVAMRENRAVLSEPALHRQAARRPRPAIALTDSLCFANRGAAE